MAGIDERFDERNPTAIPLRGAGVGWSIALLVAAALWLLTVSQARDMGIGPGTMGMALPLFLGTWVAMMGAMMLPSIAPATLASAAPPASATEGRIVRAAAHAIGFFLPWAVYGAAAFAALRGMERFVDASPTGAKWLGVGIFAAAGLYQLSPWKHRCMAHCRMSMPEAAESGGKAFRTGVIHGAACVGCCWALMAILLAVGVMNVVAMAGLTALIFLEKLWSRGPLLARVAGVAFLVMAVVAAVHPSVLGGLQPAGMAMTTAPMDGGM